MVDKKTGDKFLGFVDYLDLVAFLVEVCKEEKKSRVTPPSTSLETDDLSMIMERGNTFSLRTIQEKKLANRSHHDPSVIVSIEDPLTAATKHMLKNGVHRVAVTDSKGGLYMFLSHFFFLLLLFCALFV